MIRNMLLKADNFFFIFIFFSFVADKLASG